MAKRWTAEEEELILKLRSEGFSSREISYQLPDRTYAAVRARLAVIATDNLNRTWTEKEKELLGQMKSEGKTNKMIARALNRTPKAIATYVSRYWHSSENHTSAASDASMSNKNS